MFSPDDRIIGLLHDESEQRRRKRTVIYPAFCGIVCFWHATGICKYSDIKPIKPLHPSFVHLFTGRLQIKAQRAYCDLLDNFMATPSCITFSAICRPGQVYCPYCVPVLADRTYGLPMAHGCACLSTVTCLRRMYCG